jgi:cell volume regulation protein A
LYTVRAGVLRLSLPGSINPVVFIAPRGLITVLLYLSIPDNLKLVGFRDGILMAVVLLTALVMMAGVVSYRETEL